MKRDEIRALVLRELGRIAPEADLAALRGRALAYLRDAGSNTRPLAR